jgi:phosphoglycolate phosphatase-like HAD superfamily hydrolase
MKLLLFDVDATLISTGGAGLRALNRAFKKLLDLESAMLDIAPHGKTDPAIVREVFQKRMKDKSATEGVIAEVIAMYVEYLRDEVERSDYHVLPGIRDILAQMRQRADVLMGLATGNVESGARIKLQRGGLNEFFSFGGYGSDAEDRTDLVRRAAERAEGRHGSRIAGSDTFVIGDTPRDIDAGRKAGFKTVGVATGQYSVDQLRDAGADLAISNFETDRDSFLESVWAS